MLFADAGLAVRLAWSMAIQAAHSSTQLRFGFNQSIMRRS